MSRKPQIGQRLYEERRRLGLSQADCAEVCDVALRTYHTYEAGTATPNAESLSKLSDAGFDVLYVVAGVRNVGQLSEEQQALLTEWGLLDARGRAVVTAVMQTYNEQDAGGGN
ncbi:helix-turn-helix domain-containing protein [Pseudogulbenkiania sp. MAI-1]|uniref:helix-turn-helix domain-containing protein n=1 Tax=Pseudogulbenkiania sp. MAI-1 TaxID=990370 RepID=UPI00045E9A74|nr:helix-turn-helix transcriptional regulator [Pseudogulbenkiania sp. MAI-1]